MQGIRVTVEVLHEFFLSNSEEAKKGGSNLKVFLTKETKTNQKNTEAFT